MTEKDKRTFEAMRPKTSRAAARERERLILEKMDELLKMDEVELDLALREEFEITPQDPRYNRIKQIWRQHRA